MNQLETEWKCYGCARTLPLSAFVKDKTKRLGIGSLCYECNRARCRAYHHSDPKVKERIALRKRRFYWNNREREIKRRAVLTKAAAEQGPRQRDPERATARRKLQDAIRSGRVVKPSCCHACGSKTAARTLHGHHEDYSRPLDVVWLCAPCHGLEHRKYKDSNHD